MYAFNNFRAFPGSGAGTQAMGFAEPTPIQLRAFPVILVAGEDLLSGPRKPGTGKAATFALFLF